METAITIRYEGGDAARHNIDLFQLGASLQGFARILAVCGNFVETGKYNKQFETLAVRVFAKEGEDNCYEIVALVQGVLGTAEIWSGAAGAVLAVVVQYVLSDKDEMKHLKDIVDKLLAANAAQMERHWGVIERITQGLRPSARQALSPIDRTCTGIDLYHSGERIANLDAEDKARFERPQNEFQPTQQYTGLISELDVQTGGCKVSLDDGGSRLPAQVTDPLLQSIDNPYALALAHQSELSFLAKAELDTEGNILKLYISDLA